jgi:hypothetical protein
VTFEWDEDEDGWSFARIHEPSAHLEVIGPFGDLLRHYQWSGTAGAAKEKGFAKTRDAAKRAAEAWLLERGFHDGIRPIEKP